MLNYWKNGFFSNHNPVTDTIEGCKTLCEDYVSQNDADLKCNNISYGGSSRTACLLYGLDQCTTQSETQNTGTSSWSSYGMTRTLDTSGTDTDTGTGTGTDTVTLNFDCEGNWSSCTGACETAVARTFTQTTAPSGTGSPCPTQAEATDCNYGEDACVTAVGTCECQTHLTDNCKHGALQIGKSFCTQNKTQESCQNETSISYNQWSSFIPSEVCKWTPDT